jgi:hypothetical protein
MIVNLHKLTQEAPLQILHEKERSPSKSPQRGDFWE